MRSTTEAQDPLCLPDATLLELLSPLPYRRFAVVGDSLSAGTGDPRPGYRAAGWSERVAGLLRRAHPGADHLSTAVVGARTEKVTQGQLPRALAFEPDLVHVPSGANDIAVPNPDLAQVEHDLRRLWERAAAGGARLTAFTYGSGYVDPRFEDFPARVVRVNEVVRRLAQELDVVLVDMWDHALNARVDVVSADRIHLAAPGQAVLATEVVRHLALAG